MDVIEAFPTAFLPSGGTHSTAAVLECGYGASHKQLETQTPPAQTHGAQSDSALPGQKLLRNTSVLISCAFNRLFYIYRNLYLFYSLMFAVDLPFPCAVPPCPGPCCLGSPFLSSPGHQGSLSSIKCQIRVPKLSRDEHLNCSKTTWMWHQGTWSVLGEWLDSMASEVSNLSESMALP